MASIVGVHGMAKHQAGRHQLLSGWRPALMDGLERAGNGHVTELDLDLAFYGDLFLSPGAQSRKSGFNVDPLADLSTDEIADLEEMLSEIVTDEDVEAARKAEAEESKGYTRTPLAIQALMRAVGRRYAGASAITCLGVLRQVRGYLRDEQLAAQIDDRVAKTISADTTVLIAHSLGSVVAAQYLQNTLGHGIRLFLTLGSPLGLQFIRAAFRASPLDVPLWVNIRDRRDPVACAGALRTWWPQIAEAEDIIVENGNDTHAVERYLSRRQTGQVLWRAWARLT
jgi:hypothetical protein